MINYHEQTTFKVRNFIDKNFYKKIYKINQDLADFNQELNKATEFSVLLQKFENFLKDSLQHYTWAFYLKWGEDYQLVNSNDLDKTVPELIKLPPKNVLSNIAQKEAEFFSFSKLVSKNPELKQAFRQFYPGNKLYFLYPLNSYKGSIGFLLLDKKITNFLHFYTNRTFIKRILNKTADLLVNQQLYSEVKRKSLQNRLLVEVGKKISATLHLNEVLQTIVDSITRLVSYDAGGIFLIDRRKNILKRQVVRGYDEELLDKLLLKIDQGTYGQVIKNKKPSLIKDVKSQVKYFMVRPTTQSQVTVPLIKGEDVFGILALESDQLNHFTPADQELLETFASQAVIAIENAQLFEESLQKKRLESELIYASKIQKALLPDKPPRFHGFQISFLNIPSRIVSGDFFDLFKFNENSLGLAIGDVSGKGAPASILMAVLYAGFRSVLKEIYPVVEIVARLNNLLTETTAEGYFATFFYGVIDKKDKSFTYTNAGHNQPILLHKDLSYLRLKEGGIVLGFLGNQEYRQASVPLKSGDYMIFFTDGVTEVKNKKGEEFGEDRLIEFVQKNYGESPFGLQNRLLKSIKQFSAVQDLPDDFTLSIVYVE